MFITVLCGGVTLLRTTWLLHFCFVFKSYTTGDYKMTLNSDFFSFVKWEIGLLKVASLI